MTTATQNISIRIAVADGDKVRRELTLTGEEGQRALDKIKSATAPATKSLQAVNVAGENLRYGMESLSSHSGRLGASLTRLGPAGLAAAAAIGGLSLALAGGIREFKEAEEALNHLNAALLTTDHASGVTAREITALSEAIENSTLFKKEAVQQAAAALTSFQNIANETFTRTLKLSADLAVRLGTDLPSAADMLGRALEAPEKGLGRLARKFSDLSFAQKESIDNFVKQGDAASAQSVILEHLESKVKGLAEAQNSGLTGAADTLSDAWDDLLESFGRTVTESGAAQTSLNLLTKAVRSLQEAINPTLQQRKSELEKEIERLKHNSNTKVDEFIFGSSSKLERKKRELKKINDELALEQKKADEELRKARAAMEDDDAKRRHGKLLEMEKKYLKEYENLTLTSQQKILREGAEQRKYIIAQNKYDSNNDSAKKALAALDALTKAKLAYANKQSAGGGMDDAGERRKRAIDEITKGILQTKPSYDVSKQALDDWKAGVIANLGCASAANQKYIDLVEQIYTVKLKGIYEKSLADSDKWEDGASRALKRYADNAGNAAKNSEELFTLATKKVEDSLTDMITEGEFSLNKLKDMLRSIQQEIVRTFIRQNVTGPIAGALGGLLSGGAGGMGSMFGNLFHEGGVVGESSAARRLVPSHIFAKAPRLHSGLMPDGLMHDEFPAILQKGETVLPKNSKIGGTSIVFNITTPNAQSFMDSQGQIMNRLASHMLRHNMRNG